MQSSTTANGCKCAKGWWMRRRRDKDGEANQKRRIRPPFFPRSAAFPYFFHTAAALIFNPLI
jgi:hypothetical protein